jgi:predicted O-methyltransferase YrrM
MCDVNTLWGLDAYCKRFIDPGSRLLELGTYAGVSTSLFAEYCCQVTTIDWVIQPDAIKRFKALPNVVYVIGDFSTILPTMHAQFDNIYIDAIHSYEACKHDIELSLPLLKPGGVISGHDYVEQTKGVAIAVEEMFPTAPLNIFADSSWALRVEM